jgi:hypothetical protein
MTGQRYRWWTVLLGLIFLSGLVAFQGGILAAETIETPEAYFGFKPGADRMLFNYEQLIGYLQKLEAVSPRLKLIEIGKSPLGRTIYIAFISAPENIKNLDALKAINRRLALDADIADADREAMIEQGRVFFLATLSMHSTEVGPSQAAPLIAYQLVTAEDGEMKEWLDNVVYMMVPCHNPDGMDMVVAHYQKYRGGKYEGSSLPGVYHKYVGHDNNRDFVSLTQSDTRAIARIYNREWFPQVMVEKHQMGSTGPRYYVPPNHDPIAENIDAGIWNWAGLFGANMIKDMTAEGLAGVSQHYLFDDYWPGSTETCIWKSVIGFLTEGASARVASPIFIEANELEVDGKGLSEYKKSINMPLPWPGGWWRLGDLVEYELVSTLSIIKTASRYRREILHFRSDICRREVNKGKTQPPYYYIMPLRQHDRSELVHLVNLLHEHGVDVFCLTAPLTVEQRIYEKGDIVVPLAQPFRAFIKEVMEPQAFPVRHYTPGGKIIHPYDITSWSLPLHRGLSTVEINTPVPGLLSQLQRVDIPFRLKGNTGKDIRAAIFTVNDNESFRAAFRALQMGLAVERLDEPLKLDGTEFPRGSFVVHRGSAQAERLKGLIDEMAAAAKVVSKPVGFKATALKLPRIALVETHFHDMDAGWTRYLLDTYSLPFKVVRPGDFGKTDFSRDFDVVVFPDSRKSELMTGKRKRGDDYYSSFYPPEYIKGMGKKGLGQLMRFLERGGIIVAWGRSTALFMGNLEIPAEKGKDKGEEFRLPVRDVFSEIRKAGFDCPGSLLRLFLLENHPLTLGLKKEIGVFFEDGPVFTTSPPRFDMDRRVIGIYPEKDILLSGYCEQEEKIGNHTALVWLKKGRGQLVLFGFHPQFRAATQGTYKLLFNAMLLPPLD